MKNAPWIIAALILATGGLGSALGWNERADLLLHTAMAIVSLYVLAYALSFALRVSAVFMAQKHIAAFPSDVALPVLLGGDGSVQQKGRGRTRVAVLLLNDHQLTLTEARGGRVLVCIPSRDVLEIRETMVPLFDQQFSGLRIDHSAGHFSMLLMNQNLLNLRPLTAKKTLSQVVEQLSHSLA